MQCFAAPSLAVRSLSSLRPTLPFARSHVYINGVKRAPHSRPFAGWAPLKAMAEVGEGECLTATVPLARSVIQSNPSITPLAGGDVTAVASTSSSTGGEEAEDKAAKRRARDAERKRAKRAADTELRAREAAAKRQRRAEDPEMCARYAAVRRQRRAENAEVRVRDAAEKRQRRAADPRVKRREAESKRQRRQADPAAARALDRATQAAARARQFTQPDARFKRDFEDHSFGHSCKVCDRLWFDNNLSVIGNIKKDSSRLNALRVLWNEFGRGGLKRHGIVVDEFHPFPGHHLGDHARRTFESDS